MPLLYGLRRNSGESAVKCNEFKYSTMWLEWVSNLIPFVCLGNDDGKFARTDAEDVEVIHRHV